MPKVVSLIIGVNVRSEEMEAANYSDFLFYYTMT